MINLLFACHFPTIQDSDCFEASPLEGEVRLHSISCGNEIQSDHSRRGDWILENNLLRFVIRNESSSLTEYDAPGGTLIDAGNSDLLLELRAIDLPTPLQAQSLIEADHARLSFWHEEEEVLSYTLFVDRNTIEITSQSSSYMVYPNPHHTQKDRLLYDETSHNVMRIHGDVVDSMSSTGAFIIEDLISLDFAPLRTIFSQEGLWYSEQWDAQELWVRNEDEEIMFPIDHEIFEGYIPDFAQEWTLYKKGCAPNWSSINNPPTLGVCQPQKVRVSSGDQALRARATHQNEHVVIPKEGTTLPFFPTETPIEISAGPAFEKELLHEETEDIRLKRVIPDTYLFVPFDPQAHHTAQKQLEKLAAQGVNRNILYTRDYISPFSSTAFPHDQAVIQGQKGFLLQEEQAWLLTWPWDAIIREPGMGAIPTDIPKETQLYYSDRSNRHSISNLSFFQELREETQSVQPEFLWIEGSHEWPILFSLLDQQEPLWFLGPYTWLIDFPNTPLPNSDVIRTLHSGRVSFGNGPLIDLYQQDERLYIDAYAPSWMQSTQITLYGDGEILASWDRNETTQSHSVSIPNNISWVLATISGEHWAVSPILWFSTED